AGLSRVASTDPARTSGNPTAMPAVNRSPSTATPSAIATAGLTKVMTVARDGPTSAINAKNTRNATAVQTSARPRTDAAAFAGTGDLRQHDAEQRDGGQQQTGKSTGQMTLCVSQQPPRECNLEGGVEQQRAPANGELAQPAAPDRDGGEDECGNARPQEHDG